jgi:CheY-like chemotaxis protein
VLSQPKPDPGHRPEQFGGNRALVVDDELALAELVGSYLLRDGFEVTLAHDGRQAIERARQVDPEVMVLDLGLPLLDGVEVCRVVRTFSDCYIVMLTARNEEIDKLIGLSVGADDYLTKRSAPASCWPGSTRCCAAPAPPLPAGTPCRKHRRESSGR